MEIQPVPTSIQKENIDPAIHEVSPAPLPPISVPGYDLNSSTQRFLYSALYGLYLDIVILCFFGVAVLTGFRPGTMGLLYALIEVPVILGILGIFFYCEMGDLAREAAEKMPFLKHLNRYHV